jgi:hypothetical protein
MPRYVPNRGDVVWINFDWSVEIAADGNGAVILSGAKRSRRIPQN